MSHWVFDPISLACLIASGALYVAGVSRLWSRAGRGCGIRPWQIGAFAAGWMALVLALLSPVAAISDVLFSVHMTQHEILILVAAPLLVLGRPIVPLLWALSPRWRLRLGTWSRNHSWTAGWKGLTGPLVVWLMIGVPSCVIFLISGLGLFAAWLGEAERRAKPASWIPLFLLPALLTLAATGCESSESRYAEEITRRRADAGKKALQRYGCGSC